jgi:pilus assembly protein Flp/PilA
MIGLLARFATDESGTTAIEYSILASGIAVAIILAVNSLGTQVNTSFTNVANSLR